MDNTFDTIVAGITKKNDEGLSIQKILKSYVEENYDTNRFDKDDIDYWPNKEIQEFGYEVSQYDMQEIGTVSLIPEPDNPYDSNAIKVVHNEMGRIGYIPREDNVNLKNFINKYNNNVQISFILEGGPYKIYDSYAGKVSKKSNPFYGRIYVQAITKQTTNKTQHHVQNTNTTNQSYTPVISKTQYNYDIFTKLAMTDYDYPNPYRINPEVDFVHANNQANLTPKKKDDIDLKNPKANLIAGIISLAVFIILILFRRYFISILFLFMGIVNITAYMKYKR